VPTDLLVSDAGSHSISFQWTDNSDDEIQFQVYGGPLEGNLSYVGLANADVTSYTVSGLAPDTPYRVGVRAVNGHGPSAVAEVRSSTIATLDVHAMRADLTDSTRFGKDKVKVVAQYALLPGAEGGSGDPVVEGLTLRVGPEEGPVGLLIPPADAGWKVKKGKAKWKSPKGSPSKFSVQVDPAAGLLTVAGSKFTLPTEAANPMRLSLVIGGDGGSEIENWEEKKPGKFQVR
jgi:hypothetical protein